MQCFWGLYAFDVNANHIKVGITTNFNKGGQPYSQTSWIDVSGDLIGTSQNDLIQKENALKTALSVNFLDLRFMGDDATTIAEGLLNASSITGTRIVDGPNFKDTFGPQFATLRSYQFRAQAEYPINGRPAYLDFQEGLTFSGGGPTFAHRLALNSVPQKQMIWPATPYLVVQSGSASGYLTYPPVPGPKAPQALKFAGTVKKHDPERKGPRGWQGWTITWEYTMESVTPLSALLPTVWTF